MNFVYNYLVGNLLYRHRNFGEMKSLHGIPYTVCSCRWLLPRTEPYTRGMSLDLPCTTEGLNTASRAGFGFLDETELTPELSQLIKVCIEENVKNIIEHSKAEKLRLDIVFSKDRLTLSTLDNGVTFDGSSEPDSENGLGLRMMHASCPSWDYKRCLGYNINFMTWMTDNTQNHYTKANDMSVEELMAMTMEKKSITEEMPILRLRGIHKTYQGASPLHVLKGIDLDIHKGELVSIMGASGSGKSTLLNVIGILDTYDEGEYYLGGYLIKSLTRKQSAKLRNELIGYIFQAYNLIDFKNAMENVALPLYYRGVDRETRNNLAMQFLDKVGLKEHWHHTPMQMSGGQRQRVAIARALISHPKIILADEPTGALDSKTTQEVMDMLRKVNREEGQTVIIVTHDPDVGNQTERRIFFKDGVIFKDERGFVS